MGASSVTMRCPRCGTALRATLAPAPTTQWFPCPHCRVPVPFVLPRELPPLYSWEILPGLYPAVRIPRRPRWGWRAAAGIALALAAGLAACGAGALAVEGYLGDRPATYVVSGTVFEQRTGLPPVRALGATVVLRTDDNSSSQSLTTHANGTFTFSGVPNGGIEINVTAPGYGATDLHTFASRSYSGPTSGLTILLLPGPAQNTSSQVLSPYPDLESFLAYVGGTSALLGLAALVGALAAYAVRRPGGSVAAVVGSGAAVTSPAVVLLFSVDQAFPAVAVVAALAGACGAFSLVLAAADLSNGPDVAPSPG